MFDRRLVYRTVLLVMVFGLGGALPSAPGMAATGDKERAETFFQDAKKYLKKGDVNAAIIQLKNALQKDPGNVAARKMLGGIHLRFGNGPSAEKEFRAAIRRGASDNEVTILLGRALLLQGKFKEVLRQVKDDSSDPKIRAQILMARARAHLGLRDLENAEKAFKEADSLDPSDVRAKVGLAQALVNRGKLKDAEALVDEALKTNADSLESLVLKGELRRLHGELEPAVKYFDKVLTLNGRNLPARLGRAASLIDLNRNDEAQADLKAVFARQPKQPLASYLSALVLAKKKDFSGAQEALQQGGALLDNHMPSVFLRGAISYALNQLEQAITNLTRYVDRVPKNRKARKLLGAALIRNKEAAKAVKILEPIKEGSEKDAQFLTLMGSAYMWSGKFTEGSAMFEQAAAVAPDVAAIRTQLALSRIAEGKSDKAVGELKAAVGIDPDARQASILLTLIRLRKKNFDEALESATALRKTMKGNPLAENLIGAAHLGLGKLEDARAAFRRALEIKADFHPARMNLAQLDLREKKVKSAIKLYERVIELTPKHVGAMMALAEVAASRNRPDDVLSWLKKASAANPKSIAPGLRLISYYGQRRDFQKALGLARVLRQSSPNNVRVLEAVGRSETAVGEFVAAVETFRKLTVRAPKSARAFGLLAAAQVAAKDNESAEKSLKTAISLNPDYIPGYMAKAELLSRDGRVEQALEVAAILREKQPKSAVGPMLTGDIYMRAKQFDKALESYEAALKLEETGVLAIRRYNSQVRLGRREQGLAQLQKWVDRKDDRSARHILASSYISAKHYDDAIRESEKLFADDKNNAVLLNNLAWLYDNKSDKRGLEFAEKAYKKAPKSAAVMDTLGWILVRNGKVERGMKLLETANNLVAKQGDIVYHFAAALNKSGRAKEARRHLERILNSGVKFSEMEAAKALLKELGG